LLAVYPAGQHHCAAPLGLAVITPPSGQASCATAVAAASASSAATSITAMRFMLPAAPFMSPCGTSRVRSEPWRAWTGVSLGVVSSAEAVRPSHCDQTLSPAYSSEPFNSRHRKGAPTQVDGHSCARKRTVCYQPQRRLTVEPTAAAAESSASRQHFRVQPRSAALYMWPHTPADLCSPYAAPHAPLSRALSATPPALLSAAFVRAFTAQRGSRPILTHAVATASAR